MSFDKDTGRWTIIGDAAEYQQSKQRNQIHALLHSRGPMTPKEVADELGLKRVNVKKMMSLMRASGSLKTVDRGRYAVP